jgi:hypothetical protein
MARRLTDAAPVGGRESAVITLGELVMILELHRQGVSVSAIARQLGIDRKTVRAYIAKGLEPPTYKKRAPSTPSGIGSAHCSVSSRHANAQTSSPMLAMSRFERKPL